MAEAPNAVTLSDEATKELGSPDFGCLILGFSSATNKVTISTKSKKQKKNWKTKHKESETIYVIIQIERMVGEVRETKHKFLIYNRKDLNARNAEIIAAIKGGIQTEEEKTMEGPGDSETSEEHKQALTEHFSW